MKVTRLFSVLMLVFITALTATAQAQTVLKKADGCLVSHRSFFQPYQAPNTYEQWEEVDVLPKFELLNIYLPNSQRFPLPDTVLAFPPNALRDDLAFEYAVQFYEYHGVPDDVLITYSIVAVLPVRLNLSIPE